MSHMQQRTSQPYPKGHSQRWCRQRREGGGAQPYRQALQPCQLRAQKTEGSN